VSPVLKPLIESVKPAVVPCSGEVMIDIEGINFELGLEIIIAGVRYFVLMLLID
jgi:hypothetical protein